MNPGTRTPPSHAIDLAPLLGLGLGLVGRGRRGEGGGEGGRGGGGGGGGREGGREEERGIHIRYVHSNYNLSSCCSCCYYYYYYYNY